MRQGNKTTGAVSDSVDASRRSSPGPSQGPGRQPKASQEGRNWLSEPRTAVLVILGAVVFDRRGTPAAPGAAGAQGRGPACGERREPGGDQGRRRVWTGWVARPVSDLRRIAGGITPRCGRPRDRVALGAGSAHRRGRASARAQGLRGDLERTQALSPGHSNRDSDHGDLRPSFLE